MTLAAIAAPALIAVLLTTSFGLAHVENDSMQPALRGGDTVLYERLSTPARGDVVLFVDRYGWSDVADATLVKRVIGVEGDTVVCCETGGGRLLVNDEPVDEAYISTGRPGGVIPFRVTVPEGTVWVMGDNREESVDSRSALTSPLRGGVSVLDVRGVVRGVG